MRNIFKDMKIKKELKNFQEFKKNYSFKFKELVTDGEKVFCDGVCIKESADSEWLGEGETFVNVGFSNHGRLPKILSNLFPYEFYFKGYKFSSAEGFFQGIKFKDKKARKLVYKMSGLNSNRIKAATDFDWQKNQTILFENKEIDRHGKEYENLVDELYVSMLQNPLYVGALKAVKDKYILHAIGEPDSNLTVFTRYEFEKELNCLKDYCLKNK